MINTNRSNQIRSTQHQHWFSLFCRLGPTPRRRHQGTEKVNGTDPTSGDNQLMRLWTYQTCAEFGWYQTCETGSNCPYTQGYHTISWALELCSLLFDMSPGDVLHNIDKTNQFYGGAAYPGANYTVFPNGEVGYLLNYTLNHTQRFNEIGWLFGGCQASTKPDEYCQHESKAHECRTISSYEMKSICQHMSTHVNTCNTHKDKPAAS